MLPEILKAITARPVPDLVVVGHTDTTGTRAANFQLGLTRALMVRALLVAAGLDAGRHRRRVAWGIGSSGPDR